MKAPPISAYTALSLTARLAIGLHCFTDYCQTRELKHTEIDAFLDDMWGLPLAITSPEAFTAWEEKHPHLVEVGLGDEFSDEFQAVLRHKNISPQELRHIIESVIEIVFASFYGAPQNQQSLDSLRSVIAATTGYGVPPAPPSLFAASLFADNHGWGKPLTGSMRDQWRFANT
ncbi:MAG: hypothetical protein KDA83_18880 [Planctomycetales bacterium]|nr:hypothetical protein [Planctomycetales bacterium]